MRAALRSALMGMLCLLAWPVSVVSAGDTYLIGSRGAQKPVNFGVPPEVKSPWYMRVDVGYGFMSSGDMGIKGFDTGISRDYGELDSAGLVSAGVGLRLTPALRVEAQIDVRPYVKLGGRNRAHGNSSRWVPGEPKSFPDGQTVPTFDVSYLDVARTDDANAAYQNLMLYGFWDIAPGSVITPYVGAGIGINVRSMRRDSKDHYNCIRSTNEYFLDGEHIVDPYPVCKMADFSEKNPEASFQVGLAAAAAAGVGIKLGPSTTLDVGYRLMWQSADSQISWRRVELFPASTITFSDRLDHEIRTGIRIAFD